MQGAQDIFTTLYQRAALRGKRLEYNFLFTWFLYHEVLGEFSRPYLYGTEGPTSLRLLNGSNFDKSLVCSMLSLGSYAWTNPVLDHWFIRVFRRRNGAYQLRQWVACRCSPWGISHVHARGASTATGRVAQGRKSNSDTITTFRPPCRYSTTDE